MFTIFVGIVLIGLTAFAALPPELHGLGWRPEIAAFLKGFAPVLSLFVGIIAIFIGSADIKDKSEARKAELEMEKSEHETPK